MNNHLQNLIEQVLKHIADAKEGLPQEIFYFVSQLTPLINVDLLIKNNSGNTLLTWRHDQFHGPAWHIPGGIIRFKENIEERIEKVAKLELGCKVRFSTKPINVRNMINQTRDIRGHFVSLMYLCEIVDTPDPTRKYISGEPKPGQWSWHETAPHNLLAVHEPFRVLINDTPTLSI